MSKEHTNAIRKAYAKPLIAIEDFTLNQFIASCTIKTRTDPNWESKLQTENPLIYTLYQLGQFAEPLGCRIDTDDDMDTICYHTSTSPLFTS